jgi:hypothetical protein
MRPARGDCRETAAAETAAGCLFVAEIRLADSSDCETRVAGRATFAGRRRHNIAPLFPPAARPASKRAIAFFRQTDILIPVSRVDSTLLSMDVARVSS